MAVGGGKGGVGKTIVSTNLALLLADANKHQVVVFDGDFGNANCHTLLGITKIDHSIEEYFAQNNKLSELIRLTAYPKVGLICGAANKMDGFLAEPAIKKRLFQDLPGHWTWIFVIIDLGAGVGDETLDLYNFSDEKLVVVTPQFTSLENAYSFVKSAFIRDLKSRKRHLSSIRQLRT